MQTPAGSLQLVFVPFSKSAKFWYIVFLIFYFFFSFLAYCKEQLDGMKLRMARTGRKHYTECSLVHRKTVLLVLDKLHQLVKRISTN